MISPRALWLAAALLSGSAASLASAEDRPMTAPPGQGAPVARAIDDGPRPAALAEGNAGEARDPERSAARLAADDSELERARDAARGVDPDKDDDKGLEKARDAARRADPTGGLDCLTSRAARGAIMAKRAVTLSQALRTARDAWDGEVIDYRLCTFEGALAYELTLLSADGRVARVRVDAANGKLVKVR